jgi:hypothetical protein
VSSRARLRDSLRSGVSTSDKFEREQREDGKEVPLTKIILSQSSRYMVNWGQQTRWLDARPFADSGTFYRSTEGANAVAGTGILIFDPRWDCSEQASRLIKVSTRCTCGVLKPFYTKEQIGNIDQCEQSGLYEVQANDICNYNDLSTTYMEQLQDTRTSFFVYFFADPATVDDPEDWPAGYYKMETPTYACPPCVPPPLSQRVTHSQHGAMYSNGDSRCIVCWGVGCAVCQGWSPMTDGDVDAIPTGTRSL